MGENDVGARGQTRHQRFAPAAETGMIVITDRAQKDQAISGCGSPVDAHDMSAGSAADGDQVGGVIRIMRPDASRESLCHFSAQDAADLSRGGVAVNAGGDQDKKILQPAAALQPATEQDGQDALGGAAAGMIGNHQANGFARLNAVEHRRPAPRPQGLGQGVLDLLGG